MKTVIARILRAALPASALLAAVPAHAQDNTIRIGITLRMIVENGLKYGQMAKEQLESLNATGGINGHKVEVTLRDDECKPINYVQVTMGTSVLIKAFVAAVVGGFGNLPGAILGGLLVGVVESLGAGYVNGAYKDVYAFLLLIFVLMVKPSGILGIEAKVKA